MVSAQDLIPVLTRCFRSWAAVLLVERERRLRRRRLPDHRAQRLHPHGHVHLLLRQHAHQGHLVEEVPYAHAGAFRFGPTGPTLFVVGAIVRREKVDPTSTLAFGCLPSLRPSSLGRP